MSVQDTVLVTSEYLYDIADAIREGNGTENTYTLAQMPAAIADLTYQKIYTGTVTASTTSTSFVSVATLQLGTAAWRKDKILYIKIRDTAGRRAGYFYGSDSFYCNYYAGNNATTTVGNGPCIYYRTNSSNVVLGSSAGATGSYGVMPYQLTSAGALSIRARYNSSNSLTIDGTFSVEVYLIGWPNSDSIPWQPSA